MNKQTKYKFKSETSQLLDIMINSLYSNKEIFLRELISNASDALDKLRLEYLYKNKDLYDDSIKEELYIKILFDIDNCLLTIRDNGIGIKYEEAIKQLGTIAKSGTKEFLNRIKKNNVLTNHELIGNFGVGFYSCFIVANKVTVYSRSACVKEEEGILWESEGKDNYNITYKSKNTFGTDVIIQLKPSEKQLLEVNHLTYLITKYSNFIKFPIYLNLYNKDKNTLEFKKLNDGNIFWEKDKKDIKDIEYKEFYNKISENPAKPLAWAHHKVEGKVNYIILLYIPQYNKQNFSISVEHIRKPKIKLYIKNIFVNDNLDYLLPNYLQFIEGLVDAEDLPLNVTREILQNSPLINSIKNNLVNKVIGMLENLSVNNPILYAQFWETLGIFLKEGIIEDKVNQERLISLLRFKSSKSDKNIISLEEYIKNMNSLQDKIYYLSGINYNIVHNNPNLEIFINHNIEVLYLYDRIDEWVINYIKNYKGKKLQSLSNLDDKLIIEELKLNKQNHFTTTQNIQLKPLIVKIENIFMKYKYNNIQINKIEFTNLLINSASSLVSSNKNNITTNMYKLLAETGHDTQPFYYIFRLNINHPIIKYLINKHNSLDQNTLNEWITLLFEQALLTEQGYLDKYNDFITRINKLLTFNILIV